MQDSITGKLSSHWQIPAYAQKKLLICTEYESQTVSGVWGEFALSRPVRTLILRWGVATGPALLRFEWQSESFEWDGSVQVGGYVDAIHTMRPSAQDDPLHVILFGGHPLTYHQFPTEQPENFHYSIAAGVSQNITTWVLPYDSPLMTDVRLALVHNLRLHLYGRVPETTQRLPLSLPITLEGVTVFSS
jgi:hypothetical protein